MNSRRSNSKNGDATLRTIANFDAKLQCYSPQYTFLLSYVLTNIVLFFIAAVKEYHRWPSDRLLAWCIAIARGAAFPLNFNIALVILLACRKTMGALRTTPLNTILPIDRAMPELHSLSANLSLVGATIHTIFHCIGGITRSFWASGFGKWTYCFVTGVLLILVFLVMFVTALAPARRKNFERFLNVHLFGAALFVLLFILHGIHLGVLFSWKWIVVPCLLYVIDRIYRVATQNSVALHISLNSSHRNLIYGSNIVRLSIPKTFRYKAGQYAEINIPVISKSQWHPFTIASAPHEEDFLFIIKKLGDWTTNLHKICRNGIDPKTGEPLLSIQVRVRGPYGAPAQHVGQYEKILLISGGVGATPFCSITKSINEAISRQCMVQKGFELDESPSWRGEWDNSGSGVYASSGSGLHESSGVSSSVHDGYDDRRGPELARVGATMSYEGIGLATRNAGIHESGIQVASRDECIGSQTWVELLSMIVNTVSYNSVMLWLLLLRLFVDLMGVAFLAVDMEALGTDIFESRVLTYWDLVMAIVLLGMLLFANVVEIVAERRMCVEEVLLLVPLSIAPVVVHVLALLGIGVERGEISRHVFWTLWPLALFLYVLRYFRILGRKALLAERERRWHQTTKSVDFIWTTGTRADDGWLVEEFAEKIGASRYVRLHRFITREEADVEDGDGGGGGDRVVRDHYGRPNWKEIFDTFTKRMKNGNTAGIFFCGPASMAVQVKQAATNAMLESRYRGLASGGRADDDDTDSLARSCNVRYVFREEKF